MRSVLLIIGLLLSVTVLAQVPGKTLRLQGNGQYVGMGEVLEDVRTITFWIRFEQPVGSFTVQEQPILVRDNSGPQVFDPGEFAVYIGKTGTPDAGKLVFQRATVNQAFDIVSDQADWFANRWYHIAVVIHPQQGMHMYVNGTLQQDSDPSTDLPYMRLEGNTGTLYLGKWGNATGYGIQARFDELRFYNTALSETQIRDAMCQVLQLPNAQLLGYFNFDSPAGSILPSVAGNASGIMNGLTATDFLKSNAPVGEKSTHLYGLNPTSNIQLTESITLMVDSIQSSALGAHLYVSHDGSLFFPGSFPQFFGVWFTDTQATYSATIDYQSLGTGCDSCAELSSRDHQAIQVWANRTDFPANCAYVLQAESPGNQGWREEYWLKPKLIISSGIDDTVTACDGDDIQLIAREYQGATYLWDDGSTIRSRNVDTSGQFHVNIKWHGCEVTDTILVIEEFRPFFQLPNDTAICKGDTFYIQVPNIHDSAVYSWAGGLHFGRTYPIWYAATVPLKVIVGNCSWEDEITVSLINNFQLELGRDTTVCLGQEYVLNAPNTANIRWSTGSTGTQVRLFNQSQTVWVEAWNSCFYKTDTVEVTYEECDCHIYMANSFTPNNDGLNDLYTPVTSCYYEEFQMEIYDRWGSLVFQSEKVESPWDGTFQGNNCPEGVYTYQVRFKKYSWDETSSFERGTINLLR